MDRRSSGKEAPLRLARAPADDAGGRQPLDRLVVVAGLAQQLGGVLAEPGARPARRVARRAAELDRDAEQADRTLRARLLELRDHLPHAHQLGVQRLVEPEHRLQAAVVLAGEGLPLVARPRAEDLLDLPVRLAAGTLELLVDQVLAADAV